MATLYISEYQQVARGQSSTDQIQIVAEPPLVEQTVAITGSSAQSNAFGANTHYIRIHTDVICSVLVGAAPVATAANKRLPADWTDYFGVTPGAKIAVISNT